MNIKVVTLNQDGSVQFEGSFGPEQVRFIMEVGVNYLLAEGALPILGDEASEVDDDDDEDTFFIDGDETVN